MGIDSNLAGVELLKGTNGSKSRQTADFSKRFAFGDGHKDLKGKSIRSGAITVTSQASKFIVYTVSSVVLARLLTPQDYGLVGMVTAVTGFLRVINYAGLSTATVQRDEITHELVSTIFWINMGLGVLMTLLSLVLAPLLVLFYKEPRLYWITFAMATTFLMDAASSQHLALLRRQMRFKALAVLDISSLVGGVALSIAAAWIGFGYWSLVLSQTVTGVIPLAGAWLLEPWRPGRPRKVSGARSMVRFGSYLTATTLLNYVFRNIDNVLIGWRWGAIPLGFYQKAYGLLMLPINQVNSPISSVAISTLSRLGSDPERQRRYFVGGYSVATAITMPIVVTAAVFAADVIPFVLGNQWVSAIRMFQFLAPAALIGALIGPLGWLFVASGRTDRQFRMMLFWTSLIVLAFGLGLKYGPEGVAIGYSAMALLLVVPMCVYATRNTALRFGDILEALRYPIAASVIAGAIGFFLRVQVLTTVPLGVRAFCGCGAMLTVYAFILLVVFRQWRSYRDLLRHIVPRRGS